MTSAAEPADAVYAAGESTEAPHHDAEATTDEDDEDDEDGEEAEEEHVESVGGDDVLEEVPERAFRPRRQYKIQEVIKRRQVMLVQVVKEERGNKGAALTTYLSLAGRYAVLMPNTARGGGISRKITSAQDRSRLKEVVQDLDVPEGMGIILRTAGAARTKPEIKRDFEYLIRMWETVRDLTLKSQAPTLVYEEGSLIKRSLRDLYNKEIDEISVAGEAGYQRSARLHEDADARQCQRGEAVSRRPAAVLAHGRREPARRDVLADRAVALRRLHRHQPDRGAGLDRRQLRTLDARAPYRGHRAQDQSGGGRRSRPPASPARPRRPDRHRLHRHGREAQQPRGRAQAVAIACGRTARASRSAASRISACSRCRASASAPACWKSSTDPCPHCGGTGHVRSVSSVALQLLRGLEEILMKGATHNLVVRTRTDVALYVLNHKRGHLRDLENGFKVTLAVIADPSVSGPQAYLIDRGEQVHTLEAAKALLAAQAAASPPPWSKKPMTTRNSTPELESEVETEETEGLAEEQAAGDAGARPGRPAPQAPPPSAWPRWSARRRGARGWRSRFC